VNALRINAAGLLKEIAGAAREYPIHAPAADLTALLEAEGGAKGVQPLIGSVRLMRSQQSVFVRGWLKSELELECSRCLGDARLPVRFELAAEFFPVVDIATGQALPKPDDDLAFTIDPNHELDLSEAVRQHLILELPMRAICRETCRGLCPRCGKDLNGGACDCSDVVEDERMAPLRALLEQAMPE
jgi:uncharacterized protein